MSDAFEHAGGWPGIFAALISNTDLTEETTNAILGRMFDGQVSDAQIGAFVVAMRQKGETVPELVGMVRAMQDAATPLSAPVGAIDIVGMGGAPQRRVAALNVSTMASFVAAGAGAVVCKHGNRKASSTSGSFDLLEAIGVNFDVSPERLSKIVADVGVGFAFARTYHPSMRHVGPVRVELGIPTLFNTLGPLANPGRVTRQVVGVADETLAERMMSVLDEIGSERTWVVTGDGSLDELSTSGPSVVHQLLDGERSRFTVDPTELGIEAPASGALDGGDAAANAAIMARVFAGELGPARDIVCLNAAAGIFIAGLASDLGEGFQMANASIDDGAAQGRVDALIEASA